MTPQAKSTLKGLLACALIPGVLAALLSPILGVSVFVVSFLLAAVIGYPLVLAFRRYPQFLNGWATSLVGLLVGSALAAYMFWPLKFPELRTTSWRGPEKNPVYTMIDGVPTQVAWNDYFLLCVLFGLIGAFAGLTFWLFGVKKPAKEAPVGKAP